jgi:FkbM family methyltransferase
MTPLSKWDNDLKKIKNSNKISSKDMKTIYTQVQSFNPTYFWEIVKYLNIESKSKLEILHLYFKFDYGEKDDEYPEQLLSVQHINPHNKVLEIGGNIGRNSCIIASLLKDSKNLVVLESDPKHAKELEHNRNQNHLSFSIESSALSARPLIQKDWDTKPLVETGIPEGWKSVPIIDYSSLVEKYKIKFDTLVLDCEGAFYYILINFPEILDGIQLIIIENDFKTTDQGNWVHSKLQENGFEKVESQSNPAAQNNFKDEFHQVWRRNDKILFYAYYEKNTSYKENFSFFLENGIHGDVDYIIIINGQCSVEIPNKPNIKIFYRENKGFDFGAYSYAINKREKKYKYYFFMNTSVKGPYYPQNGFQYWPEYFINLLSNDTKLVGTTISILPTQMYNAYTLTKIYNHDAPFTHVQSMFFVIDNEAFEYLNKINFFNEKELLDKNIDYIIAMKEIGLSQNILKKGWNITCLLPEYRNQDYRTLKNEINPYAKAGDTYYPRSYFGKDIKPQDVIFFKRYRLNQ